MVPMIHGSHFQCRKEGSEGAVDIVLRHCGRETSQGSSTLEYSYHVQTGLTCLSLYVLLVP